jgi:predicted KAP-like P-loop ATPase
MEPMARKQATVHTDQATKVDRLSFAPYRDTLVDVVRRAETPLTVGVFGAWGSGKTSLLLMLQHALNKPTGKPKAKVVWFNAWQYGQETALWRALLSRVLEALRVMFPRKIGHTVKSDS